MNQQRASETVAAAIRDYRQSRGWTIAELAERCGLSRDVISDIENGRKDRYGTRRREITIGELMIIAEALNVSVRHLLPARAAIATWPEEEKMLIQADAIVVRETKRLLELENEQFVLTEKIAETRAVIERQQAIIERLRHCDTCAGEED